MTSVRAVWGFVGGILLALFLVSILGSGGATADNGTNCVCRALEKQNQILSRIERKIRN